MRRNDRERWKSKSSRPIIALVDRRTVPPCHERRRGSRTGPPQLDFDVEFLTESEHGGHQTREMFALCSRLSIRQLASLAVAAGALTCVASCREETTKPYLTIDDLPDCDPNRPSLGCVEKLFLPLLDTEWPFDRARVDRAYELGATEVVPGWHLTALHVRQANGGSGPPPDCYAAEFEFAEPGASIDRGECGTFLFLGGHPQSAACKLNEVRMTTCVDKVPVAEAFDIGVVAGPSNGSTLEVRTDVQVGEEVFIVGQPSFLGILNESELNRLSPRYPLVSSGRVLKLDGRGMVISNLAFNGNSGGPVLDREGRVVGVVYTKLNLLRQQGTPTDPALADHRTVAVRIDAAMKARIDAEAAISRTP